MHKDSYRQIIIINWDNIDCKTCNVSFYLDYQRISRNREWHDLNSCQWESSDNIHVIGFLSLRVITSRLSHCLKWEIPYVIQACSLLTRGMSVTWNLSFSSIISKHSFCSWLNLRLKGWVSSQQRVRHFLCLAPPVHWMACRPKDLS